MTTHTATSIQVASRLDGFDYAIRNIVAEARAVEKSGRTVHYLNIGDPVLFGFQATNLCPDSVGLTLWGSEGAGIGVKGLSSPARTPHYHASPRHVGWGGLQDP